MTEEQIQAEVERRFAAQNPPSVAEPAKKPSREEWESINPSGDYDAAMRMRDAAPMAVQADADDAMAEVYRKVREAEDKAAAEAAKNKSSTPGLDAAMSAYTQLPEDAQTAAMAAGGYGLGKLIRAGAPQDLVMGTPEFREAEARKQVIMDRVEPAQRSAGDAARTAFGAQDQYLDRSRILEQQRVLAEQQHAASQAELRRAQAQFANAQTLSVDEELARRAGAGALPPAAPAPELTRQPVGGQGTFKYATEFGATPDEAMKVPSMSSMQKQNIPQQAGALNKIEKIAPGFQSVAESPLLLGEEGRKAVLERTTTQANAATQQQARADAERKRMADAVARHKAAVQLELERAQEAAKAAAKAAAEAAKAHNAHIASSPVTPAQSAARDTAERAAQEAARAAEQVKPGWLSRYGKIAGRFVPGAGAALAPLEAAEAKEEYDKKNYGRAAIMGLGALGGLAQATAIPPVVMLGNLAQIPAAGLSIYDLATGSEKPQPAPRQ
jgi:hypothetical protein